MFDCAEPKSKNAKGGLPIGAMVAIIIGGVSMGVPLGKAQSRAIEPARSSAITIDPKKASVYTALSV